MSTMRPGLLAVAAREVRWILRDPVARFLLFGVPVIAFLVLGYAFSNAVVRGLSVAVVDQDHSTVSAEFVQTLAAVPGIAVDVRGSDLGAAAHAIRSGDAIAAVYLPPDFGKDLRAGRRPQVVAFYNTQYFTPGNTAAKGIRDALAAASAAAAPATAALAGAHLADAPPGLVAEEYVLSNPAMNYAAFLLRALLPTVLHVVVAIVAGYAVGSEFRRRGLREWWDASGHSVAAALAGKMLPYFVVATALFAGMVGILDGWLGVGFRGSGVLTAAAAMLLVVAYLMIGCLMQLLTRNMATGLSLTGILVSPAFGYAGIGFPVIAMEPFARAWGALLPLRWYVQILFDQAARGSPVQDSAVPFAILLGLALLSTLLVWLRFRALARRGFALPVGSEAAEQPPATGIAGCFAAEWRRVLRDRGVLSLMVLGPAFYSIFYPQPYLGMVVRDIPIAVVDQDHSEVSRGLMQALEAHGNVSIALRASSFREAEEAIRARRAYGIVGIPPDTERNLLKGVQARLPVYADSTYFLVFNRTLQGMLEALQAYAQDRLGHGARREGPRGLALTSALSPAAVVLVPLFNPTASYASYVVPAAFVLILHQTLLMGAATLGGAAFERAGGQGRGARASAPAILGQALAHWTIYVPAVLLYFVVMPRVYGFSTLGSPWQVAAVAFPFILATSFLGQALGLAFRHRETAVLLVLASSLPQFFLVGVSWPSEALPAFLRDARHLLPSVSAIDAIVRIGQMGATPAEVRGLWGTLWALALLYFVLAVLAAGVRPLRWWRIDAHSV
ncbi:ABC transporter permease [Falsiroseomonas sp. HW251]|uniref:ABC transporter permease n=1 Tax=Falsiroseomonas sp. HW251 TaxID=3390998 RepID=UPI003D31EC69